jgi:exopolyphosphatase/guanosine-5'-triphosphate,3'-diphosphate pyrophosphatase
MSRRRKFVLIKFVILFVIIFSFLAHHYLYHKFCIETRYAFDFGSGAIKSRAVEFDACTNTVNKIFGQFDKPIKFIHCLIPTGNGAYHVDEKCINRAIIEFNNFENEYNISCHKHKCAGVATAWARKADNIGIIIKALKRNGVMMKVLSQFDEGLYGFNAVINSPDVEGVDPQNVIVWDLGGGSFQLSTLDLEGKLNVYNGSHGVESFERELRRELNLPADAPLPFFAGAEFEKALNYAYEKYGRSILEDKVIANKLKNNKKVQVYAIGNPMTKGIKKQMYVPEHATLEDLKHTALIFENRTADDVYWNSFPELPTHYVKSAQISLILVYGIMRGLGVEKIDIIDTTLSHYVLYDKDLWRNK